MRGGEAHFRNSGANGVVYRSEHTMCLEPRIYEFFQDEAFQAEVLELHPKN